MATLINDVLIRSLLRQDVPYTPVWLMRQAGRYLPEYRATRQRAGSFMALAQSPALATEVTMQPLQRSKLDAAILFSDILTVPDAMGLGLSFAEGEGPRFAHPVRDQAAVDELPVAPLDKLRYVFDAVSEIRRALDGQVPLIGFCGSPFTLACYMIEGGASKDFSVIKSMLYRNPDLLEQILKKNVASLVAYLNAQIEAGAQVVMMFDTWGGALADRAYQRFSLAPMRQVLNGVLRNHEGRRVPRIVFTKGGGQWLEQQADIDADALGVDWTTDLGGARRRIDDRCALQGNLDPQALFAKPEQIETEIAATLESFGDVAAGAGHVFNLGHGISQFTPPEAVSVAVDAVHRLSRRFHVVQTIARRSAQASYFAGQSRTRFGAE
jgi:uroporphyrinogen decarboxylase